ncbi:dipeptidase [Pseudoduganella sp. OTU4001]|uniref:dipeptidase n=1 Tax=Pseudoduganella sp. OTU4001 TaxID=3043854 RepID=UPI00313D925D
MKFRSTRTLAFAVAAAFALPLAASAAPSGDAALAHARALLDKVPLIDGHNDLPWTIREDAAHSMDIEHYDLRQRTPHETDLARLKQGKLSAQFWSVYVPGELKTGWAVAQLEQIDLARRMIAKYPEMLVLATRSSDIAKAKREGKIASFLGMEGGHVIENSLGALRAYYELGARYMTLTHNSTLDWVDAALGERKHGGLTAFGKEVVREMNRLGMLVDLSHVSPEVMHQALDTSEAPVIFSHSSARALNDHPRNVPDEVLKRLPANGGVVMVTFVPTFISPQVAAWRKGLMQAVGSAEAGTPEFKEREAAYIAKVGPAPKATLAQVADHIEHVARTAGHDHVGIAGDYYGATNPEGLEDVSTYPALFAELVRRGWNDKDLAKLAGGNLVRAFARAEQVAARLQKERKPSLARVGSPAPQNP